MPTYEYACTACSYRYERHQRFDEPPALCCPKCGGKAKRLINSTPVIFRGSGFYVTDYRRPNPAASDEKPPEVKPAVKPPKEEKKD